MLSYDKTIETLGGDPANPFVLFDDVQSALNDVKDRFLSKEAAARKEEFKSWESSNGALASKLQDFISLKLPNLDFSSIDQKADQATRAASKTVLGFPS